jgi:PAS domain S-box-containing protein
MKDEDKINGQIIAELVELRQRVADLEKSQIMGKWSEEEYKTILSTAMDGFWLVDKQGRFLDMNDAYCHLIGYSRDELLKMRIQDVEAAEKPEETASHIRQVMETGSDRFETRHKCKDGRTIDIEVSVNYMDVEGGRFFVFLRDITERKWADETMRKKK